MVASEKAAKSRRGREARPAPRDYSSLLVVLLFVRMEGLRYDNCLTSAVS